MIGSGVMVGEWTHHAALALRSRFLRGASMALVVTLSACGGDGATAPKLPSANDPVAGTFALATVNAQPVPYNIFNEGGFRLALSGSTLALQADGNFVLASTTVETVAGFSSTYADTARGTWTQNVANVTLRGTDGSTATATWDGRQIALDVDTEGQTLKTVYRKGP